MGRNTSVCSTIAFPAARRLQEWTVELLLDEARGLMEAWEMLKVGKIVRFAMLDTDGVGKG